MKKIICRILATLFGIIVAAYIIVAHLAGASTLAGDIKDWWTRSGKPMYEIIEKLGPWNALIGVLIFIVLINIPGSWYKFILRRFGVWEFESAHSKQDNSTGEVAQNSLRSKSRGVAEKSKARREWQNAIDRKRNQGESASSIAELGEWRDSVINMFGNFLVDPEPYKKEFLDRTSGLLGSDLSSKNAVREGLEYLRSKRGTIAASELR